MLLSMTSFSTLIPASRAARKRHHLADRHADVGVVRHRLIPPAPFGVLRPLDQTHRTLQLFLDALVAGHPVHLAQEQRGKPMAVHRALAGVRGDQPRLLAAVQDEIQAVLDLPAIASPAGKIPRLHERQTRQGRDAGVIGIALHAGGVAAVAGLPLGKPGESFFDRRLLLRA